jgi:formate dehydrogenase accessory protein FdhE
MIVSTSVRAEFERRSARADALPPSPILSFVSLLCRAQGAIAAGLERVIPSEARNPLDDAGDSSPSARLGMTHLLPLVESFLRTIAEKGPEELVVQALARLDDDAPTARARLMTYWNGDVTARDDYLSRAILRPYAEVLRARGATLDRLHNPGHCPFCGGAPMISTRREIPDAAEAAMRMLHCGLCGLEWKFNRACCPACAEEKPDKLPVYKSDAHPAVRIEACETCGRYVKSIDLTMDARPIAEIDDVVSLSMDLWAIDEGLTRIEPGLAGV